VAHHEPASHGDKAGAPIQALLIEDHTIVREGLKLILSQLPDLRLLGDAATGADGLSMFKRLIHRGQPVDVVITDLGLPDISGLEVTRRIKALRPETRVLILSMHSSGEFVRRALKAGASGYLVKDSAPQELRMAIEAIARDEVYLSPRVSRQLVSGIVDGRIEAAESSIDNLTPRQREVLQLIAEGKSTKEIAFVLKVSTKTVETHRTALMDRLGIRDIPGLVLYALREKLLDPEGPQA
jgi:DNA-binding NarL/FixJ family response regulator